MREEEERGGRERGEREGGERGGREERERGEGEREGRGDRKRIVLSWGRWCKTTYRKRKGNLDKHDYQEYDI